MLLSVDENINGKTSVLGLIGNPVEHTFSPQIHNTISKFSGINLVYAPFLVGNANIGAAIHGAFALNIAGLNVTVPYKKSVIPYLVGIDSMAEKIGAVNTLKLTEHGYEGYNTDIYGIMDTFERHGFSPCGLNAVIIGAGGSANAAAVALAELGAAKITILNRTLNNAETLANNIKKYYNLDVSSALVSDIGIISKSDIIIQATTAGFGIQKEISPVALENGQVFKNTKFVLDLIYSPWETIFLKEAKKHCPVCLNGFDMLFYQAVAAYKIFLSTHYGHSGISKHLSYDNTLLLRDTLENYYINNILNQGGN